MLRPLVVNLLVLYSHGGIKVDDLQAKTRGVVRLDVPVSNVKLVKICEALDEAPAYLSDLPTKLLRNGRDVMHESIHFR